MEQIFSRSTIVTVDYGCNLEQMMIIVEIAQVSPNQRGEKLSLWSQIDHVYWPVKNQQTRVGFLMGMGDISRLGVPGQATNMWSGRPSKLSV